jgi:predicted glycosyltransferase
VISRHEFVAADNMDGEMRIWIDLDNSPAALLFAPISRRLRELGHETVLSARDNAQTRELALERWPEVAIIGGPAPPRPADKVRSTVQRVRDLGGWARARHPDVALSHNSYAQIIAARALGIPVVTAMDYEHHPINHVAFRLAGTVLLPEAMRSINVRRLGATARKVTFYPGLKEQLYLGDFQPDAHVLEQFGLGATSRPIVVLARTPPSRATYHQFENPLFVEALRLAGGQPDTAVIVLTRYPEQRDLIARLDIENLHVPEAALDSRSLMHGADVMIGAGGTMTREAALLGVLTYGLYAGRSPAVDRYLEDRGMLVRLTSARQMLPLRRARHTELDLASLRESARRLIDVWVDAVIIAATAGARRRRRT